MKQEHNGDKKINLKQIALRAAILMAVLLCFWILSRMSGDSDTPAEGTPNPTEEAQEIAVIYHFRSENELRQHFEKHGAEFDYQTPEEYEAGANRVIADERSLHKLEKEDGDDVYYLEETNEFVVVSQKGVIRTYFKPSAGKAYYDRQ